MSRGGSVDAYGGIHVAAKDHDLLHQCAIEKLTFVTFDVSTVPAAIAILAARGESHEGVVYCSTKTHAYHDYGAWSRSLVAFWRRECDACWTNRVGFLGKE